MKNYLALGDGYWKTDHLEKARAVWQEGLKQFPDNQPLKDATGATEGTNSKNSLRQISIRTSAWILTLKELWRQSSQELKAGSLLCSSRAGHSLCSG